MILARRSAGHGRPGSDLPLVQADPGLLERVLANLVTNALRYSAADAPPHLSPAALATGSRSWYRPRSRHPTRPMGPRLSPLPAPGRHRQHHRRGARLGPRAGPHEAMGGTLEPQETPGEGLTMVVSLRAVPGDNVHPLAAVSATRTTRDTRAGGRRRATAAARADHPPAGLALRGARRLIRRRSSPSRVCLPAGPRHPRPGPPA